MSNPSSPMQVAMRMLYTWDLKLLIVSIYYFWFMPFPSRFDCPMKISLRNIFWFKLSLSWFEFNSLFNSVAEFLPYVNTIVFDSFAMFFISEKYSFNISTSFALFGWVSTSLTSSIYSISFEVDKLLLLLLLFTEFLLFLLFTEPLFCFFPSTISSISSSISLSSSPLFPPHL